MNAEGMFIIRVQFLSEHVRSCQSDGTSRIPRSEIKITIPADLVRSIERTISNAPLKGIAGLSSGPPDQGDK
jgi:hypothetical protein